MISVLIAAMTLAQVSQTPPPLQVERWLNTSHPVKWSDYKGKVVVIHSSPGFCCGYDFSAALLKKTLEHYLGQVAVVGVSYVEFNKEQKEIWDEVKTRVKIDWPVALDENGKYIERLFPDENMPRWSYVFIDRKGHRRDIKLERLNQVEEIVKKLVAEK